MEPLVACIQRITCLQKLLLHMVRLWSITLFEKPVGDMDSFYTNLIGSVS